ncbi:MAG: efflux transporter permease subunit [Mucilaginibacter sp.]|nr:efflux transporter permease subunit [Mucilaginibacter sp.]
MNLIKSALRKPITIIVVVAGFILFGIAALTQINIDIFPNLNLPSIYVAQPYGGMSPQQMEGFISSNYQGLYLYITGIKSVEANNVQGLSLLKLSFYNGTNMAQAAAEVTSLTNRAFASMPDGTPPPIILRFDASSLPVGQLTLSSNKRNNNELQDLASTLVRPTFSSVPGLSSPPPVGGNVRTVVIDVDPALMRSHNLTPQEITAAVQDNNQISPAGNVRIGGIMYLTPANTVIKKVKDFENIPLQYQNGTTVFLKDIARVTDGADITSGYAYIDGKRSIYMPIIKTASASTWSVVQGLKQQLPYMQSLLPPDVKLKFEFDQSVYVINSVKSLISEGVIGAILTGIMVLLFLRDWRSAIIVIVNIPISIIIGGLLLKLFGQTINIMTLGGLALAIGILVDESTVTIENIHRHQEMGKTKTRAIADACEEIALPKLLILLSILAVFVPAFFMTGIPQGMFMPLSLAVGFSMIAAFLLSQTFVPVLSNWLLKDHQLEDTSKPHKATSFEKFEEHFLNFLRKLMNRRSLIIILYVVISFGIVVVGVMNLGTDILPKVNTGQFQLRIKAPVGTRLENTEAYMLKAQQNIYDLVGGKQNVEIISSFAGSHPSTYPTIPIIFFMSASDQAIMQVALNPNYKTDMDGLEEKIRHRLHQVMPEVLVTFEPIDLTDKIMSQGSTTPIEVAVTGKNLNQSQAYANKLIAGLKKIPFLRDVQQKEALNYPSINIDIDRQKVKQLGLTMSNVASTVTDATSSSRFTQKVLWLDENNATSYNVQVQVPEYNMKKLSDIAAIPLLKGQQTPTLGDVATLKISTMVEQYDRKGAVRFLSIGANINQVDLGRASKAVDKVIKDAGQPPVGIKVEKRGLTSLLDETMSSLQSGLLITIIVLLLMLAANYQSFKLAFVVVTTIPSVLAGSMILLWITGSTLNLQSYMGIIMSVGVSVANAILLVTNAEHIRLESNESIQSAIKAAGLRLRPILMTSISMVVGMIPMASGLGESGAQTAPLGRAVIGGLIASTIASLLILPLIFSIVQKKSAITSVSLDPDDETSTFYDKDKAPVTH